MKVIIAGSRDINDYELVKEVIEMSDFDITEVVSGKCRGVDTLGERWAKENGIPVKPFPANWYPDGKNLDKSQGPKRNTKMVNYVGKGGGLILVWNGISSGSSDILDKSIAFGLKVFERITQCE